MRTGWGAASVGPPPDPGAPAAATSCDWGPEAQNIPKLAARTRDHAQLQVGLGQIQSTRATSGLTLSEVRRPDNITK